MSVWFPLHSYSLPMPQQWVALKDRVLVLYSHGLVMLDQDMNTQFLPLPNVISFTAGESHWAFQTPDGLLWGEIDDNPSLVSIPNGHHLIQYSYQGMVTRCGSKRFWFSFHDMQPVSIPSGCTKTKIYHDTLHWNDGGIFYSWTPKHGTRQVGQLLEDFEQYLVGPNDWIAAISEKGVYFMHHGQSFLVGDVTEVLFHCDDEKVLLNRSEGVEVLNLTERRFSSQYLPECDELIGFASFPLILGLEKRYFFSTSMYIQEPDGKGPEFSEPVIVMRNMHSVLGLAGSMWSLHENGTPKWIEDVPDFDDGWVGDSGYLLLVEERLLYMSNQGEIELIEEEFSSSDDDILEIEDLGMFVHHSRVEQEPIEIAGIPLDDSLQSWAWSNDGLWIDLQ